jgi:Cys-tRNA(Pro)/Cys-tRNA(Cys) deacylase
LLAVIPGDGELDEKALARVTGDRRVNTVSLREVQPLTGHVRGGVTALGLAKRYPVYLDESAYAHERISVSAGTRGLQILLSPADYRNAVLAHAARIARPKA